MSMLNTLRGGDLVIELASRPLVMGIINVNEDSFYAPSRISSHDSLLQKVEEMVIAGVDMVDIGAMSSRPGAKLSDPQKEGKIIQEYLRLVRKSFPDLFISVDTIWGNVAKITVEEGGNMINDISAGSFDTSLWDVVSHYNLPYVLMHMKGNPETMQSLPEYDDVLQDLTSFFSESLRRLHTRGIHQIVLDPGFGFGKTTQHNFKLLENLSVFQIFDLPILIGISRKSFIYKSLELKPEQVLSANSALHALALQKGANILRVHDVIEAKQVITLNELLKKG